MNIWLQIYSNPMLHLAISRGGELKAITVSKDLTKGVHLIIMGGRGNNLDREPNYKIENDIDNTGKKSTHTNVGFVGLLEHHNRPHMKK
jgi:hypothetical protein